MLRLIPRLDIKNKNLIKTINMEGLRKIGDPNIFAKEYSESGADELLLMDVVASLYDRNNLFEVINIISKDIFIPITVGGGVRSVEDARKLLNNGSDKVAINSAALKNSFLISELANHIGSCSIVLSIEAKKISNDWYAFSNCGRDNSGKKVIDWLKQAVRLGVGEVILTSIDKEGTESGFDLDLLKSLAQLNINFPLIISGGIRNISDIDMARKILNISGVSLASVLHYKKITINEIKKDLNILK